MKTSQSMHLSRTLAFCLVLGVAAAPVAPFATAPASAISARDVVTRAKTVANEVGGDVASAASVAKNVAQKNVVSARKQVRRGVAIARTVKRITETVPPTTVPGSAVSASPGVVIAPTGSYAVQELVLTFVDTARPTEATEKAPGAPHRTLETLVLAPLDPPPGQIFPLVVFGHGLGAKPRDYIDLLRPLAASGYVVAAPRFPVGSQPAKTFNHYLDRMSAEISQPGDLSFVITQLLALAAQPGPLQGRIDATRIGAAGHSLGATTVLDLAANTCCSDPRVRAVVPISGFLNPVTPGAYFTTPAVPMLLIHGDKDKTVPLAVGSAFVYAAAGKPTALLTLIGGDHVFRIGGRNESRALVGALVVSAMINFLDQHLKGAPDGIDRLRALVASQPSVLRLQQ